MLNFKLWLHIHSPNIISIGSNSDIFLLVFPLKTYSLIVCHCIKTIFTLNVFFSIMSTSHQRVEGEILVCCWPPLASQYCIMFSPNWTDYGKNYCTNNWISFVLSFLCVFFREHINSFMEFFLTNLISFILWLAKKKLLVLLDDFFFFFFLVCDFFDYIEKSLRKKSWISSLNFSSSSSERELRGSRRDLSVTNIDLTNESSRKRNPISPRPKC